MNKGTFMRIGWWLGCLLPAFPACATVDVFLDFDAQWRGNLAAVAVGAGVPAFDDFEISQIQDAIQAEFIAQLLGFDVQVSTVSMGGFRERVYFGARTPSTTDLGTSMVDFLNMSAGTSSVFSANFGFIVEADEGRSRQIAELSTALAGTGLHELGHSFGLRHHHAYGDPRITPDMYANTQGIQNLHLMATGTTGITEEQREQRRTYSQWSKVIMEAASNLTPDPIPSQEEFGDVGQTPSTALPLDLNWREISQTWAGFVFAKLRNEADIDLFAIDVPGPSQLTAEIWSNALTAFVDDFDSELKLFGPDGLTLLAANDQIRYDGSTFDAGTQRETDSLLLNIPLPVAGRYYLEVSSNGPVTDPDGGGLYQLLVALGSPVPEPQMGSWMAVILAWSLGIRPRFRMASRA